MGLLDFLNKILPSSGTSKPKKKKKSVSTPQTSKKQTLAHKKKKATQKDPAFSLKVPSKTKSRKKSKQIKAEPIDETALGFSISLKADDAYAKKRNAIRVPVKGLTVYIHRLKKSFKTSDISATGLGFKFAKPRIKGGVKLEMDIILNGTKMASGVLCKVMRHEGGNVGCQFVDLDRAQDDAVNKVVLIGQKEQAARKAAKKDEGFKQPS